MPGWSASVAALRAPTGAFFWALAEPALHDRPRLFEPLAHVRREQLRGHRRIAAGRFGIMQYAQRIPPVELIRFGQKNMRLPIARQYPLEHGGILSAKTTAAIDDEHQSHQRFTYVEVMLHQLQPTSAHLVRNLGESVTR